MKLTEKILGLLGLIGITLIFSTIPGGSMLSVLGLSALSVFYMYFGFAFFNGIRVRDMFKKSSYAGIKGIRIVGGIATGFVLAIVIIGVLFKVMMWPGSSAMLMEGLLLALILLLISAIKYSGNKATYYKMILIRTAVFGGIALFLFLLPPYAIMEIRYKCCPEYVNAVKELDKNPDDAALQGKVNEERSRMSRMAGEE